MSPGEGHTSRWPFENVRYLTYAMAAKVEAGRSHRNAKISDGLMALAPLQSTDLFEKQEPSKPLNTS